MSTKQPKSLIKFCANRCGYQFKHHELSYKTCNECDRQKRIETQQRKELRKKAKEEKDRLVLLKRNEKIEERKQKIEEERLAKHNYEWNVKHKERELLKQQRKRINKKYFNKD